MIIHLAECEVQTEIGTLPIDHTALKEFRAAANKTFLPFFFFFPFKYCVRIEEVIINSINCIVQSIAMASWS